MPWSRLAQASVERGRARHELTLDPNHILPESSQPSRLKNSKLIVKDLKWKPQETSKNEPLKDMNQNFCKACRRLFEGKGRHTVNLSKTDEDGMFFEHLDANFLRISVKIGCPLCTIVWQGYEKARLQLARGEELPLRYDFGHYLGDDVGIRKMFAVRFYPFTLLESRGTVLPMQLPLITVTLGKATGEGVRQSCYSHD